MADAHIFGIHITIGSSLDLTELYTVYGPDYFIFCNQRDPESFGDSKYVYFIRSSPIHSVLFIKN